MSSADNTIVSLANDISAAQMVHELIAETQMFIKAHGVNAATGCSAQAMLSINTSQLHLTIISATTATSIFGLPMTWTGTMRLFTSCVESAMRASVALDS